MIRWVEEPSSDRLPWKAFGNVLLAVVVGWVLAFAVVAGLVWVARWALLALGWGGLIGL